MGTTNILDLNNRINELADSYPADKVMMPDGVTSVEGAVDELKSGLASKLECVKVYIDDVEFPTGRSGDLYANLPSQYASRTIVSAFAFSLSKAIKPYITSFDNANKSVQYYTENSESSALTRTVVVTVLIV